MVGRQHRWWGGSGGGCVMDVDGGWQVVNAGGVVVMVAGRRR